MQFLLDDSIYGSRKGSSAKRRKRARAANISTRY
jgi:hypothetical protein